MNESRAKDNEAGALKTSATSPSVGLSAETPFDSHNETPPLASPNPALSINRSERIPDPERFKGNRSELDTFASKIREKLIVNLDRFPTPRLVLPISLAVWMAQPMLKFIHTFATGYIRS